MIMLRPKPAVYLIVLQVRHRLNFVPFHSEITQSQGGDPPGGQQGGSVLHYPSYPTEHVQDTGERSTAWGVTVL